MDKNDRVHYSCFDCSNNGNNLEKFFWKCFVNPIQKDNDDFLSS